MNEQEVGTAFPQRLAALIEGGQLASARRLTYRRGALVYYEGKEERSLLRLEQGIVRLESYSVDGKVCVHGLRSGGSVFGELSFLAPHRSEAAVAMKDLVVTRVSADEVLELGTAEGWASEIVAFLGARVAKQQRLINSFVTLDCRRRLAIVLIQLSHSVGQDTAEGRRIQERVSQEVLGSMVGTTRSRVGSFLQEFRDAGLVSDSSADGMVIDPAALEQLAGVSNVV